MSDRPFEIPFRFETFAFVPPSGLVVENTEHLGLGVPEEDLEAVIGEPRIAGLEYPAELGLFFGIGFGPHPLEDLPGDVHGEFPVRHLDVALGGGDGSSLPEFDDASALVPLLYTEVLHQGYLALCEDGTIFADPLTVHYAASADARAAFHVPF